MRSTFLPVSLAAGAINVVFFQRASTEFDREALEGLVRRVLRLQVWLGVPLTVFFTANAVTIFAFVFGAGWQEAGAFAALLAPPSFLVLLTSWLDRIYDVLGRQKVRLVLELIYDAILMATLLTGFALGAGAWQAVLAFSVINSVYHLVWLGVTFAVARFSAELYVETLAQVAGMTALSLLVHLGASKFFSPIGYSAVILLFVVVVSAAVAGRALVGALRSGGAERPAMPR
jgi:O-antigen/teichoic acid export membrane protein